jgi:hypothetical protein
MAAPKFQVQNPDNIRVANTKEENRKKHAAAAAFAVGNEDAFQSAIRRKAFEEEFQKNGFRKPKADILSPVTVAEDNLLKGQETESTEDFFFFNHSDAAFSKLLRNVYDGIKNKAHAKIFVKALHGLGPQKLAEAKRLAIADARKAQSAQNQNTGLNANQNIQNQNPKPSAPTAEQVEANRSESKVSRAPLNQPSRIQSNAPHPQMKPSARNKALEELNELLLDIGIQTASAAGNYVFRVLTMLSPIVEPLARDAGFRGIDVIRESGGALSFILIGDSGLSLRVSPQVEDKFSLSQSPDTIMPAPDCKYGHKGAPSLQPGFLQEGDNDPFRDYIPSR